jgi:hypothetical protein
MRSTYYVCIVSMMDGSQIGLSNVRKFIVFFKYVNVWFDHYGGVCMSKK